MQGSKWAKQTVFLSLEASSFYDFDCQGQITGKRVQKLKNMFVCRMQENMQAEKFLGINKACGM